MIPLLQGEVMEKRKWIKKEDCLELLTRAQGAPGPISLNSAVFVGYSLARYKGALAAILGVILPSFSIMLIIALYLAGFRTNHYIDAAFKGMRPAVVALIAAPVINLARGMGAWKIAAAVAAAVAVWLLGVSPMWFIAGGAVAGIIYAFYNKKGVTDPAAPGSGADDASDAESKSGECPDTGRDGKPGRRNRKGGKP